MIDPAEPMPRRPSEPSDLELTTRRRVLVARNLTVALAALLFLGMLFTTTYVVVTMRTTQVTNTGTLETSKKTLAAIRSCTTPGRKCYDAGQKRTAAAVGDINRVVILAAACSSGLPEGLSVGDRQARIQTCVINRLSADSAGH